MAKPRTKRARVGADGAQGRQARKPAARGRRSPGAGAGAGARARGDRKRGRVRYAVVGLGYIAQAAVLPAFAHARKNSELAALVSDDPVKLRGLARRYRVAHTFSYAEYADCLASGLIDAVYIALPNHLHRPYSEEAARAGIHVLCEKPMALTEEDCESMIRTAEEHDVRLMIAYRLHFEAANLAAMEIVRSGKLGSRASSTRSFTMNVKEGDIRLDRELGGGTLYDIGVYCIQAARHVFGEEPMEVFAAAATREEARFAEVDEMVAATLRFPQDQLASFTTSFGAADVSRYEVVGTKGTLRLDQPSGYEGMRDVRIIRALMRSAEIGKPQHLSVIPPPEDPSLDQEIRRPPVRKPELIHAESPSGK